MTTNKEHEEIHLLYQNAANNLAALKKSQWQVYVFYSAAAAFLITQANNSNNMSPLVKIFTFVAFSIGAVFAMILLELYWSSIDKERKILKSIYCHFGTAFNICRSPKGEVQERDYFEILFRLGGFIYIVLIYIFVLLTFWCN